MAKIKLNFAFASILRIKTCNACQKGRRQPFAVGHMFENMD